MAAKLFVVNLKVGHGAAELTPPAVATENLPPQRIHTTPVEFRSKRAHKALLLRLSRKIFSVGLPLVFVKNK